MEPIQHLMAGALRTPMPEQERSGRALRLSHLPRLPQPSLAPLGWRRPDPRADCA